MEPQHNPYGGGPQFGPPSGQYPPGQPSQGGAPYPGTPQQPPHGGGPYPGGPQQPPPFPGPPGYGQPPPRRRTGLVVGLVAGGAALVVIAVTLVLVLGSGPTRISDLADLHDAIEAEYEVEPFVGIGEIDGQHTVYVSTYLDGVHGAGELRGNADRLFELIWEELPGSFDRAVVSLTGDSGSPFVQSMTAGELREDFGSRPRGLESVETNGREPTVHRAGDCSRGPDYCNEPAEALATENTRTLMERTCRKVDWREFPAEPIVIRNHDQDLSGAESSVTYLLSDPTRSATDFVTVMVIGDRDEFIEVSCSVGGDWTYETYDRTDYEDAAD